ncbi:MAG: hypothetical protein ACREEM_03190 [Blastocatellia bacterium]
MKPEEWRQIEQLYLDGLERPPEQRPAFLAAACADDNEAIRREVESLLANEGEMEQFLETPPGIFAARLLAKREAPSMAGCTLGHYQMHLPYYERKGG